MESTEACTEDSLLAAKAHLVFPPMRAVQLSAVNQLVLAEVPAPSPAAGEVVVRLRAAALNHRDVWIKLGQYAGLKLPCIPGSDGAGVVSAVAAGVDPAWIGREVIINASFGWGDDERVQGAGFSILGLPRDGTLAEQIAVPVVQLAPKPAHLSWAEAAALPLAGLTAWRALISRARLQPGERILLCGIGGGVALFALQFAVAHGAEVWVTSGSDDKIARAVALGARGGFNYNSTGWAAAAAKTPGLFAVVLDSAGGEGFESLLDLAAPGGRVVFFGATRGNPPALPMRKVFWRQLSLLGTTMGSPADWAAMTDFVARHRLIPVVSDVFPLTRAAEAFALMERGGQFGKIVVEI
jgi:NADPH:quinone reductase-like Zn-dependent oxidoreductase